MLSLKMQVFMASKKQFLQLLLLFLQLILTASLNSISKNQTFREGDLLISKGKRFAFGFFSPGNSYTRYLGIWFYKVSNKSVAWVANRDNPVNGSLGVLSIDQHGNLVLYNDPNQKVPLWSANVSFESSDSCMVQLLDTGNLILVRGESKTIVWQSFDYPTDTLLPEMRIGRNHKTGVEWILNSWRSEDDPATGDYSLKFNLRGLHQMFLYEGPKPRWRSLPWPWIPFSDIFNYTLVVNQEEIYYITHISDDSIIVRIMVDSLGIIKWLRWHEHYGQWKVFWSTTKAICDLYAECGANSKCDSSNRNRFQCSCLPGYKPKSSRDWHLRDPSGGCVRKRLESFSMCMHGEGFVKVGNIKLPETSVASLVGTNMSLTGCEQKCLMNCSCSAYAKLDDGVKESKCWAWYGELMDTVHLSDVSTDLHVRVDAIELAEIARKSNAFGKKQLKILMLSIASAWLTLSFLVYLWLTKRRKARRKKLGNRIFDPINGSIYYKNTLVAHELGGTNRPADITFFDRSTIVTATINFSPANLIGQGGFGSVYKGQLFNGQVVAVKRLSGNSVHGVEEFKNEVMLIAKLQHRNLVKLLGCCIEGGDQMLIYEYLPNKSLDLILFDQTRRSELDWGKRFNILIGTARGILYLHEDSRLRIIHRDLKSSNILLDADMNPKISDFGMARIFRPDQIQENTKRVVGTYGYMSPEYAVFGKFSVKSDVFSFGVILLEIVSGKKSNDLELMESSLSLIGHVWEQWCKGSVLDIIDSSLQKESYNPNEILRCIQIGLLCVQEKAVDRPNMLEVVLMLSSEKSLPNPKQPAFVFREFSSGSSKSYSFEEENHHQILKS